MKDSTVVVNAMNTILSVPGNTQCADCSGTDVQWASINLGIALCIECSGVHRGLGVHVSKVRSLNLDNEDSSWQPYPRERVALAHKKLQGHGSRQLML